MDDWIEQPTDSSLDAQIQKVIQIFP